jgi:hypothetical protein
MVLDATEARGRAEHAEARRIMSPPRQRLTLRVTWRRVAMGFSMQFVVAKKRRRVDGSSSLRTVRVSPSPSRRLAAASG